ncbi:MAG TPA: metallophosphoesterase family protein [Candidatus Paceibacterota bacterium]
MIFVTGDTHGDYERFKTKTFLKQAELNKEDYLIICGDFGYWKDTPDQSYWLDWLDNKSFTTLWIDGNHENFDMLMQIEVTHWNGGNVQFIRPSVIHLMRGQVFTIDGCKIFTFGGARSHDIQGGILDPLDPRLEEKLYANKLLSIPVRVDHVSWWKEEQPTKEEMAEGIENLDTHQNKVDYTITHECAADTKKELFTDEYDPQDYLSPYLQKIKEKADFKKWYFGHHHRDESINDKEIAIYKRIIRIW